MNNNNTAADEQIIDENSLNMIKRIGDEKLLNELINIYIATVPKKIVEIKKGLLDHDFQLIEESSHSLVSSSGNIGALAIMDLSRTIENAAHVKNENIIKPAIDEIQENFAKVRTYLNQIKNG